MIEEETTDLQAEAWVAERSEGAPLEIEKATSITRAWFATVCGDSFYAKWIPENLTAAWADAERSIAGGDLHPAIVPLQRAVHTADGQLLLFPRVVGQNLGDQTVRAAFARLPFPTRREAVLTVCEALNAVREAGFTVVDWYEGNMLYDFDNSRLWLFDWELCVRGPSFVLEMDANYGSSRLMAPEEFVRGSVIDEASLVFNLGRYALLNLPELAEQSPEILAKATWPAKAGRYRTVREFLSALSD